MPCDRDAGQRVTRGDEPRDHTQLHAAAEPGADAYSRPGTDPVICTRIFLADTPSGLAVTNGCRINARFTISLRDRFQTGCSWHAAQRGSFSILLAGYQNRGDTVADDQGTHAADKHGGVVRCEQCGSREHVVIGSCHICARCSAVWPVQGSREAVLVL